MSDNVNYRNIKISADEVRTDPLRCPKCESRTLTLYGNIQRPCMEVLEDGKRVKLDIDHDGDPDLEILTMDCHKCETRFIIQSPDMQELEEEYLMVKDAFVKLSESRMTN